ncbi:hypothetical protein QBC47DRAFT_176012 [Echria macrotheca]|uniref:Uncharacterized protein n=1 Tax=Echria macrotheca TaxID=438768 RepID=A0AAJ0BFY3_9PEZI|nr:hypothetical protein QBC47DRAFT_176012 [Echria macrotheca]
MSNGFGLSCPNGGKFYICQGNATEFVGCCTSDPCADGKGTCPTKDLKPATFSADSFKDIPAQQCAGGSSSGSGSALWYTCQKTSPPFLGCCTTNPCSNGSCPSNRLAPAKLSSNSTARAAFISMGGAQTTKSSTTRSATSTKATATSTSSSTSASTTPTTTSTGLPATAAPTQAGLSTGAVAGIAIGAAAIALAGAIFIFVAYKRGWFRRRSDRERDSYTTPFITGAVSPYEPHNSPALAPQRGSHAHSASASTFNLLAHPPSTPTKQQQLYPGYQAQHLPPQSPPLSSNPGSAHSSPQMRSYPGHASSTMSMMSMSNISSSTYSHQPPHHHHLQPLSELETPLMLSELPSSDNNEPHHHPPPSHHNSDTGPAPPYALRPGPAGGGGAGQAAPQRWGTNVTRNELHLWDGSRDPRGRADGNNTGGGY